METEEVSCRNIQNKIDSGSSDDDDDVDNYMEEEIELFVSAKCLFCEESFSNPTQAFSHCQLNHSCSILEVIRSWNMDSLHYIRFINFIRAKRVAWSDIPLKSHAEQSAPWQGDEYLQPVLENDGLLQFDVESFVCGNDDEHAAADPVRIVRRLSSSEGDANIDMSPSSSNGGLPQVVYWQRRALAAEQALQMATATMERMKVVTQEIFSAADDDDAAALSSERDESKLRTIPADSDAVYFDSYGHHGIHQEMLQDEARTASYKACFYENKTQFTDSVVLDVGCGSGILSMFAATAGARSVVSVEMSDIIYQAMDIVRENGFENKIKLVKGRMEDVDIGVEKVDVIVSEWMGYFLLFESMLDSVIYARDRYLKPGGLMLPNRVTLHIVGVDSTDANWRALKFWDDVHGFRMSCMRSSVLREAGIAVVSPASLVTTSALIKDLDTATCSVSDLDFESAFELMAERDGELAAFAGSFDTHFSCVANQISFSTGPHAQPTHWQQTVFLLPNAVPVTKGQKLSCVLKCCKNRKDPRSLCVTISLDGHKYNYAVD